MEAIGRRLTYANVVSTLALFLVLAGGAAIAARVPKKSVGPSQLKANAVTTAKIKANAVTTRKIKRNAVANAKIKDGAVESEKIADGSVSLTDLDSTTIPYSRVVHKARGSSPLAIAEALKVVPLGESTYTQAANENDSFVGALDVTFSADCKAPRDVTAYLLLDAPKPPEFETDEVVGLGYVRDDTGTGGMSERVEIGPGGDPGGTGAVATGTSFEPGSAENHKLSLVAMGSCSAGTGITASFGGVNVIATK
jgi:hypothetical protein